MIIPWKRYITIATHQRSLLKISEIARNSPEIPLFTNNFAEKPFNHAKIAQKYHKTE